jgi:elongation factor P
MAALIEAIAIKRKMFFEYGGAPYHCLDVEVSKPTARGGQTLVRLKMRTLLTRAVFDRTFKAGEKFTEPDLVKVSASYQYAGSDGYHFMDDESFETLTLSGDMLGDDRLLLADSIVVQIQKYNGAPIGLEFPPHVEMTVAHTEPGTRGDTASGSVTKAATTDTGLEIRVPLFIKEGERVKVHTETREFAGRA